MQKFLVPYKFYDDMETVRGRWVEAATNDDAKQLLRAELQGQPRRAFVVVYTVMVLNKNIDNPEFGPTQTIA